MEEGKSLKEELQEIKELVKDTERKPKKQREFRIPFKGKVSGKRVRDNWITVMKVNENNNISFARHKIEDQTVMVDNVPRLATGKYVLNYKRKPLMIVPSWSVEPFAPENNYEETEKKNMNIRGYKLLMNKMKTEAIMPTKKMGGWAIAIGGLVIGAIIIYALFTG